MARSRLSYAEAVRVLTGGTDHTAVLSRLAGGALLLAAPFVPGALALFDAKGEANALLRDLVGAAPARIRAARGKRHYELIEAAHTVLVISSYFDALAEIDGPRSPGRGAGRSARGRSASRSARPSPSTSSPSTPSSCWRSWPTTGAGPAGAHTAPGSTTPPCGPCCPTSR
ncbi:hypothetical protein ACFFX1_07790 [Dactylosporangium sucinum]|uniref:NACHT N-terminal Helical domain-containing protein n=1 Tax=Dactylosporangium sucinum TaxID=1424081 RepID=A0A917U3Z3_9ACTN|nr:hypothetical protein [Dactylosporangium sucinum]GGM56123.1 hypothetical protein GCM10007977_067270 [Dactylosporangium sucinum]